MIRRLISMYRRDGVCVEFGIETSAIDLRYEHCRLRHRAGERVLLSSIAEAGIRECLLGITKGDLFVLLDGFKRIRCAKKLGIASVPVRSLSDDEATGILALMRLCNARSLTLLEQAAMIDELKRAHKMSAKDIAQKLEKSVGWVSVRQGILDTMSSEVRHKIMNGEFPMYSYMYDLKRFMRLNSSDNKETEAFVKATAGKGLSVRDISALATGFFRGGENLRNQIVAGNFGVCLSSLRQGEQGGRDLLPEERRIVQDLDIVQSRMMRLRGSLSGAGFKSPGFFSEACLLIEGILRIQGVFMQAIRSFYDRSRPPLNDTDSSSKGGEGQGDCSLP
jgi:DNA-binding transcriptional regulator YiaG